MVVDHAVDVGPDPPLIAVVELLEGMIVAGADGGHQRLVGDFRPSA
ncbi:MAG: hypothetical protein ACXWZZ_01870 [Solirubrobacteraceae bacterium]